MSDNRIEKVAGQVPGILHAAADHLRKMAEDNTELVKRAEAAEHEVRIMKIARRMEIRGLEPSLSFEEKVAMLQDVEPDRLGSLEHAVEIAAGGVSLGRVERLEEASSKAASGEFHSSDDDDLDVFVLSQQAYT